MRSKLAALLPVLLSILCGKPFFGSKWSEKYIIVMDAGSTGSRIYIYKYDDEYPLETIAEVAHMRVIPALSTFVNDSAGLTLQLNKLVDFAKEITPSALWATTSICLKATAGLRSLKDADKTFLVDATRSVLEKSEFLCDASKTKVISGGEEALFDVLAVTALFQSYKEGFVTLGAADMGGSSQQISFLFSKNSSNATINEEASGIDPNRRQEVIIDQNRDQINFETSGVTSSQHRCKADWRISIPGSAEIVEIYSKSMEYMGLIAAMDAVIENFYSEKHPFREELNDEDATNSLATSNFSNHGMHHLQDSGVQLHPCLPRGAFPYVPEFAKYPQPLYGSGDFDRCHQLLRELFVPQARLTLDLECVKQRRPKVLVGMDNFPKALEVLGIPQGISVAPSEVRRLAVMACKRPWEELLTDNPTFMPYRAQRACFGASYVYTMLVDVYGIEEDDKEAFLPVDTVGEHELSWALGAAVFSALNMEVFH